MKNKQQEAKESLAWLVAYIAQLEQKRDYLDAKCAELEEQINKPIIANCCINGEGIKEGWSFSGCDDKSIVTPLPQKEE